MKKVLLFFVFILLFVQSFLLHAQPYHSLAIDGYNADVIANGVGVVTSSTTNDIDDSNHYLLAEDWKLDASQPLSGTGLPMNGIISSTIPEMKFLLQNYSANNSIRLNTTIPSVTSNLVTPIQARKLFVLTTSGLTSTALEVIVIFEDDTTELFLSRVPDWFSGTTLPVVHKNFGRLKGSNVLETPTDNPRLYQVTLNISKQNQLKKVKQIKFSRPITFEGVLNIFAVSTELLDSCPSPEFVKFSKVTMNGVEAALDFPVLPATVYQYELRTSGLPGSGNIGLVESRNFNENTNSLTFNYLVSSTEYFFYVRSVCSETNQGYWKGPFRFTTLCSAVNTPYKVPLDALGTPNAPACTTILNANEDDYTWITEGSGSGFEGPVLKYRYNPNRSADDWFFTRGINVTRGETYRLRFKYTDKRFSEKLRVSLGKFAYPEAMTTEIFNVNTGGADRVTDKLIEFTADETGVIYIGFQVYSDADQFFLYLGDIEVTQSSCHRLLWGLSGWVCEGGPITLEAQANYGTLRWYDSRTSTEVLGEGSTFVTPPLTESKSYYVKSYLEDSKGGKQSLSTNSNDTQTNVAWGISFDLLDPGTIKSTTVYASQSGSIRVAILNSSGREVYTSNVIAINAAGPTVPITVPLNAVLNAGNGYKMILKEVNNAKLFVDQTVLFPMYDSHNSLRVTSSLIPLENRALYAYFFELVYQRECSTSGVVIDATVVKAVAPTADQAIQHFCKSSNPTLADIAITGTNVRWYASQTGGVALPNTTPLVHNTTYYASQFLYACESPMRTAVKVVVEEARLQTSGINVHYNYGTDSQMVGTSIYNALGSTELQWYTGETGGLPVGTPAFSTLAVGNYDYWVSGVVNGCESARSHIGMTIRPLSIWVTAQPTRKVYGEEDPALLYRVSGLVNDDELTGTLTRDPGEHVGSYAISRGTLAASSNYILNVDNSNFRILPATLTITATDKTKGYGEEDPAFTYTVSGLKREEEATAILSGVLNRELGEGVGSYEIRQGSLVATTNYEIEYQHANLEITPTLLTVTAYPQIKTYGEADPALTYTISGLQFNEQASTVFTGSLTRVAGEAKGTYAIEQGSLQANANYTFHYEGDNLEIQAAELTVTAEPKTKRYGEADPALTYTVSGLQFNEQASDVFTGHLIRLPGEIKGIYAIGKGILSANANYTFNYEGDNLTIDAASVTVTAEPKTKTYGEADPVLTYTVSGLQFNEQASDVFTGDLVRVPGEAKGTYAIEQRYLSANSNYIFDYEGADLEIQAAELTVTAEPKTKVYGEADPTLTYAVSGLQFNEQASTVFTGNLVRVPGEAKGTYAIEQGDLHANANYTFNYVGADLTIQATPLTVTAVAQTKVYGEVDPVLTYTVSGLQNGEQASTVFTGSLTRVAGEAKGTYAIEQGSLQANANYTFHYEGDNLEIQAAELTVTAEPKTKTYGEADPALTYTVSGLQFNEQASTVITGSLTRVAGEAKGTYAIEQGDLRANANYTFHYEGDDLEIQAAELTITAEPKTKVYGEADPTLTYAVSGLQFNEQASTVFTGNLVRVPGEAKGTYAIEQGDLRANANYTFNYVGADLKIQAAELTVTAESKTKVYGEADPTLTYAVSGLQFNEQASTVFTGNLIRVAGEAKGTYAIEQGNLRANANYTFNYVGADLKIQAAELTVTAESKTKVYGEADPVLTYTVSGLKGNDDLAMVMQGTLSRESGESVGDYIIQQGTVALLSANYILLYDSANLEIQPATLTLKADAKTKEYGEADPALTYTITGLQFNEQASTVFTGSLTRVAGESVGDYAIQKGSLVAMANYNLVYEGADFTITPAELIVTATVQTKAYGQTDPTLTYTVSGLKWNDDMATVMQGSLSRESGELVGTYPIKQGDLATTANYTFTFVGAHLTIHPIELRISPVANQTKVYGQADPTLTFTVSGLSNGDTVENALVGTLGRTNSENVGLHSYKLGSLQAVQRNYNLVLVDEERFAITPAAIAIVVNPNQQKRVGQADPVFTYTVNGLQRGDYPANVLMGQLEREIGESVGTYAIAQGSLAPRANYTLQSFTTNVFEIKQASITGLTLPAQSFVYDGGVKRLQVEGLLAEGAVVTYENNEQTQVGRYTVAATIDYGRNYEPLRLLGILTITSATQDIRFNAPTLVVMEDTPTLQLQATASSGLPISYTIDDPAVAVVDAAGMLRFLQPGFATITAHQEGDSNYKAATPVSQTIEVTSRDASIWDLEIDGVKYGKIEGELQVVLSCDNQQQEVHFVVTTQKGANVQPSNDFIVPVPTYGRYEQVITVQAQNGTVIKTYKIVIDKRIPTENIVFQKYNNVLLVNNNKQTNGGYVFSAYEWFKNGASMGKKQFYSAGSDSGTTFDASAVYEVELTLHNGQKIRSCPIALESKQAANWTVYPNPVEKSAWLTVRLDDNRQETTEYAIYSIKGQLIKRGQLDPTKMGIEIPATVATGSYYLVLKTADKQEGIQFIIK